MSRNTWAGSVLAALLGVLVPGAPVAAAELMADFNIGRFRVFDGPGGKAALADPQGFTLYTFAKDDFEQSTCVDACAQEWLAAIATPEDRGGFESFSVFIRADGTRQWAYEGKPLYRYVKDTAPGQVSGEGADGAWHIVAISAHAM